MTTSNEELIAELQQLANEIEISYRIESIEEAVKALQSQEERIKELERESETHSKAYGLAIVERDNLRAEVEAVRKANLDCVDHYNAALDEINELGQQLKVAQEGWRCECSIDDACKPAVLQPEGYKLVPIEATREMQDAAEKYYRDTDQKPKGQWWWNRLYQAYIAAAPAPQPAQDVTELVDALERLARLGNGEHYGNSDGNMIARTALSKYKGAK